jgi:hypothetical protein
MCIVMRIRGSGCYSGALKVRGSGCLSSAHEVSNSDLGVHALLFDFPIPVNRSHGYEQHLVPLRTMSHRRTRTRGADRRELGHLCRRPTIKHIKVLRMYSRIPGKGEMAF